jgi:hypothetical protein
MRRFLPGWKISADGGERFRLTNAVIGRGR